MSTNTLVRIAVRAAILIVLILVSSAWFAACTKQEQRDLALELSTSVGADLADGTNSRALTGVTAELQSDIQLMHASPTRAIIQTGDDDPPVGGGSAHARLVLTNEAGHALTLRLRPETDPGTGLRKFRVLGYRKTEPGGAANRGQPAGSGTNRTSGAAGPGG